MIKQGMNRVLGRVQSERDRKARKAIKGKAELRWWLVYGPPRSGTTHMVRLIQTCSRLYVSDWGLDPLLNHIPDWIQSRSSPDFAYIRFDYSRLLKDISSNIIDNAYAGGGLQIDLLYKQATLGWDEYQTLVKLWGPPARSIFCFREPAGTIASSVKKFIYDSVERLQEVYIRSMNTYFQIGGDLFEYTPELSTPDYVSFLEPLNFAGRRLVPFKYRGEQDHAHATDEMWSTYHSIKALVKS